MPDAEQQALWVLCSSPVGQDRYFRAMERSLDLTGLSSARLITSPRPSTDKEQFFDLDTWTRKRQRCLELPYNICIIRENVAGQDGILSYVGCGRWPRYEVQTHQPN